MPSIPDFLLSSSSIWDGLRCSFSIRKVTAEGSTAPERVPIIKPSSGVRPMVVSMTCLLYTSRFVETLHLSPENAVFPENADVFVAVGAACYAANSAPMDFDDLLCNAVQLFLKCPDVLEYYQNRFRYIMEMCIRDRW